MADDGTASNEADSPPDVEPPMPTTLQDSQASQPDYSEPRAHGTAPPGGTIFPPGAAISAAMNPRSCVTCRRRKVRCDKHMPCANCRRAKIPCMFPAPGRAPRRPRPKVPGAHPPSSAVKLQSSERELELMTRLRKLEGIVEDLSGQIEIEAVRHPASVSNSPDGGTAGYGGDNLHGSRLPGASPGGSARGLASVTDSTPGGSSPGPGRLKSGSSKGFGATIRSPASDTSKQFGKLVLSDRGTSRYVSSGFWTSITDELDQIRKESHLLTDEESDESDVDISPASSGQERSLTHQSFVFGYSSVDIDLKSFHPLPSQIPYIWQVYQENVDPVVKILHVPTVDNLMREIRVNLDKLTPSSEALMFAIYYAAITSLEDEEVTLNFGAEREFLLKQYRFALEQALSRANFLVDPDITICQAFVLFLVLVRRHDDTQFAWTLVGLLVRMSQAIGLHRDGSHFPNLSPFEVEMRRRLFWAVCTLDIRSAEDQGTDLMIVERTFDTQLPLNINDTDIDSSSKEAPPAREDHTDMTFTLIRFEICVLARRLHVASSTTALSLCPRDANLTFEQRDAILQDAYNHIESVYLKDSSGEGSAIHWVASHITRLIVAKMTLLVYQRVLFPSPTGDDLPVASRERLFMAAISIFEYSHLLNTDPRAKQWRWLFRTYTHWQAVAYGLLEMSRREWSATVERAWSALNSAFSGQRLPELDKMVDHIAVWLPFRRLFYKVRRHREAELARLRSDPAAAGRLDLEERRRAQPTHFGALSGQVKSAIAHERWRKLVNAPQPLSMADLKQSDSQPASQGSVAKAGMTSKDQLMDEIMDSTISGQRLFLPSDFFPIAYNSMNSTDAARDIIFGGADVPMQHSTGLAGVSPASSSMPAAEVPNGIVSQFQENKHETPYKFPPKDDNPPPWLWSTMPILGESADGLANAPVAMPETADVGGDMDVNMDEGFDWQGWGESIRGFELEALGPTANGVWGHGL